jgi:hypothetical protein
MSETPLALQFPELNPVQLDLLEEFIQEQM